VLSSMPARDPSLPAEEDIAAIVNARHGDPFAVLGMHVADGVISVRAMLPQAVSVAVLDAATGMPVASLRRIHAAGFFAGSIPGCTEPFAYRLELQTGNTRTQIEDPYRFGLVAGDVDLYLFGEGTHRRLYEMLGAHERTMNGVAGTSFIVWAPSARRVSVVADFNDWDGRRHPMRRRTGGIWEIFLPSVALGSRYKYEIVGQAGTLLPLKADPFAFACEASPGTASLVAVAGQAQWQDTTWMERRAETGRCEDPVSIYEVHLGSWRRGDANRYLSYDEIGDRLIPYVRMMGFTHIELMPISEHPFDGSWGYQPIGMFAPTSRFGSPQDFARFVDRAHQAGVGVILDWVPGHFPTDAHGLGRFDGTALYEHADIRQGFQPDWNTLVFNFGRHEVADFLLANALFWFDRYHVDGLRVDAVASMLYLDYSRKHDEWVPNKYGGRENLDAISLLQSVNSLVSSEVRGAITIAEESTAWPNVSQPVSDGGLGFTYKWNMGWMHDSLEYMREDPIYRRYHQDQLTFSFTYAFNERFVLPLSHDEVVYGKRSLLEKMPGDEWQQRANLRALFGFMFGYPGKKLIFMGGEFGQLREWNHDRALDWYLFDDARHRGIADFVRACNAIYRELPALHELDTNAAGLEWITSEVDESVVAFVRKSSNEPAIAIIVTNFTPVVRHDFRLGVPRPGVYEERLNSDMTAYGGSGVCNSPKEAEPIEAHGRPCSITLTLPPLATMVFTSGLGPSNDY
jgi:1,4-alpha-glucan branching enzyme